MSLPEDPHREPSPPEPPPPPPAPEATPPEPPPPPEPAAPEATPPEPTTRREGETRPAGTRAGEDRQRHELARDLDEVQRGRPERAFNTGAVVGIVVTVAAAIFVIQNNQTTEFDWLWFDFELPLWTALLGAVAVGVVLVVALMAVHDRRQRRIGRRRDAAGRLRQALTPPSADRESTPEPDARPAHRRWSLRRPRRDGPMRA